MGREKVENAPPEAYKINLPTKITLLRILLVPFLLAFLIAPSRVNALMAALIFGVAALTDWLDGHLARSTQQVTTLGQLLDPIADKILLAAGLIPLVGLGRVPAWVAAIMLIREFAVSGLREIAAAEQVIIPASPMAKAKTVLQIAAILFLILNYQSWPLSFHTVGMGLLTLSLVLSLVSGVEYYLKCRQGLQYRW
ncbi:MAG TPA: CDP-diacylglycerol--glycerol-3-phosphate 3-phosphatidyltransferase [Candidatus Tectomicrobia bacterium]|nr:CDP-diacylglycerol--glycerol-3-phosphate 3-phosphatidyltransferase [Candidatus Tectomicrobia bacterium]